MKAFHGKKEIKEKYLARVKAHQKADRIIQKIYWDGEKGCAVGCTLEKSNDHGNIHEEYEKELGIPKEIAILQDRLFEMMTLEESKKFPAQFLSSISVGADLKLVPLKFKLYVNKNNLKLQEQNAKRFPAMKEMYSKVLDSINQVITLLNEEIKTGKRDKAAWSAAWSAARSAAWSAARSAARSAESAAISAESAARPAADSATWSAESAADSATWSAESAAISAESAAISARSAPTTKMKNDLLKLLKEAK